MVEEQLILLSAGTAARREAASGSVAQLGPAIDWRRMTELLRIRRLLPTLGPRIAELAGAHASEQFGVAVAEALEAGRRQGVLLQMIAARAMGALAQAGIRSSALKGPLLGEALYGDPGRRPSSDIDLLVASERLGDAVEVVRELGYAPPADRVGADGLPLLHFALLHEHGQWPPVELHWRIHWYESRFARDRLLAPSEIQDGAWRPAPIDELMALLLFYARDGFVGLRHATDIGAWWDAFGAGLRPGAMEEPIAAYPELGPALAVAATVAERTVGLPAAQLGAARAKVGMRGRLAIRLADPYPHASEVQVYADMGLIDGLLSPPGSFREFLRRQVVPPREDALAEDAGSARRAGVVRSAAAVGAATAQGARVLGRDGLAQTRLLPGPRPARAR
jgi:hypothetical protein